MEKRHISYVLFWESLYTAAMALFFGLVAAGVFSKLLQLVLVRLIGGEATFGLNIRLMSIGYTVVFFGALFLLLYLCACRGAGVQTNPTSVELYCADYNADGKIDNLDVYDLMMHLAKVGAGLAEK